ncbi:unnamed protein product [Ambrosiozyma monospora]|uniref:Unnamed protein product n=1 Tax=Ambrosiozyma monospora TaxID=43982 RepID=A0ACB5SXK3_AMBMO|nr:unnamed protein product [Ambrosiozyma monospora]
MKTMKPQMHLSLSRQGSIKDVPSSGRMTPTGYMTPVHAMTPTSYQFQTPAYNFAGRSNSITSFQSDYSYSGGDAMMADCTQVSSINSSIYTPECDTTPSYDHDFTQRFDDILISIYHGYLNKPNITPFNPSYPPSGIVSKISKQMYQKLLKDRSLQLDKNFKRNEDLMSDSKQAYCLALIRRRLLELCNMDALPSTPSSSRSNSMNGNTMPGTPQYNNQMSMGGPKPSWLHQNPMYSATRLSSTDSLVDTVQFSANGPMQPQQLHQHQLQPLMQLQQQQPVQHSHHHHHQSPTHHHQSPSHNQAPYFPSYDSMITPPSSQGSPYNKLTQLQAPSSPALGDASQFHFHNGANKYKPAKLQPSIP